MQEYHFHVTTLNWSADLVLGGEWTLHELTGFILKTIDFEFDHAYEFGDNLKLISKAKERYSLFADRGDLDANDPGVMHTKVSSVFKAKKKMLLSYDYGDHWRFIVTCTEIKLSEAKRRFRKVLATQGEAPVQYDVYL